AASLLLVGCASTATSGPEAPTRIILLIADGAGVAHWTLAAFADEDLAIRRMRTIGLVDGRGSDHTVSGSAPTATAYATGMRTFMGAVGVGPDGAPAETVVEAALARGMSTGLMTTTALADATPAAFGAHAVSRSALGDISRQMSTKGITVLMGGGRATFRPAMQPDSSDLLAEVRDSYTYVESLEALRSLDLDTVETLLGLFAEGDMGVVADRGSALQWMTSAALRILGRNPNGFFLMVENEESDTQAHRNADMGTITAEMLDFDAAVGLALDYQARHPETLVLVTSDHETGGISLTYDETREIVMEYASTGHTGTLIPLFASGPGAERFAGIIENYRVGEILLQMVR
ncbi:MAG: alkaline phosphatase, partial [Gemmatimonadota bacterium]|nr:alkaline phosphatase [Gemmatimonadota bacterium]